MAGTVNWGTATVIGVFAGMLYGGSKEASASVVSFLFYYMLQSSFAYLSSVEIYDFICPTRAIIPPIMQNFVKCDAKKRMHSSGRSLGKWILRYQKI